MIGCVLVNLSGVALGQFGLALVLLGLGWNFMFVGGTTLLTEPYAPAEKAKVQAVNDFTVFGVVAVASLSRSEERRVGNECGSTCRCGWLLDPYTTTYATMGA